MISAITFRELTPLRVAKSFITFPNCITSLLVLPNPLIITPTNSAPSVALTPAYLANKEAVFTISDETLRKSPKDLTIAAVASAESCIEIPNLYPLFWASVITPRSAFKFLPVKPVCLDSSTDAFSISVNCLRTNAPAATIPPAPTFIAPFIPAPSRPHVLVNN